MTVDEFVGTHGGDLLKEGQLRDMDVLGLGTTAPFEALLRDSTVDHSKRIVEDEQRLSDKLIPGGSPGACGS